MILPAQRKAATLAIQRAGRSCELRREGGGVTNDYGKVEGGSFTTFANEQVVRAYGGGGSEPEATRETGGRLPADSPLLLFRHDSQIEAGVRVLYGDTTYEVDSVTEYPTHYEAQTTLVN